MAFNDSTGTVTEDTSATANGDVYDGVGAAGDEIHYIDRTGAPAVHTAGSSDVLTYYGEFTIDESTGLWTYTLDDALPQVQALGASTSVADVITVYSSGSPVSTITVTVNGTNDAPVVDLDNSSGSFDFSASYTEGGTAADIGTGITVSDVDSGDIVTQADIVNTNPNPGDNFIVGPLPGGITLSGASTASHVILTGNASQASYAAALATVRFFNSGDDPTAGGNTSRILQTTVTDGIATSAIVTTTVAVTGVNDAPDISQQGTDSITASGTEANSPLSGSSTLTVRDPDSADTVTSAVTGVVATDTTLGLGSSNAQLLAMLTVAPGPTNADPTDTSNLSWAFNSAPEAFDYLAGTEHLTLTYTIQSTDNGSPMLSDTQDVVITINGSNDAPVISTTGSDSLSIGVTETSIPLLGSATLTARDPDYSDTLAVSTTAVVASGTTVGLTSTNAELLAMLSVPPSIAANPTDTSNLNYGFDSTPQTFDYLAVGESLTLTYTIQVDDGNAGTDTQDVAVVVTGSNDAPDISQQGTDRILATGTEGNTPLSGSFTLTVRDPDLSDTVTASVTAVVASGTTLGLADTNAQLLAMLSVTPGAIDADPADINNLGWSFNSTPEAFDYLDDGESLTLTYTIQVSDGHGGTDTQDVDVVISGTNDAPTLGLVSPSDSDSVSLSDGNAALAAQGTLTVNDPDQSDSVNATVFSLAATPAFAGGFSLMTVVPPMNAADPGTLANLTWRFAAGPNTFDYLAAGETQSLTYTLLVTDDNGTPATKSVVVTVHGINEAPVVGTSVLPSTAVVELPDGSPGENSATLSGSGTINFTDTDLSDTHSASFVADGSGYSGVFSLGAVNQAGDTVGWTFNVNDGLINWLGAGVTLHQSYTVTIDDGHGGTSSIVIPVDLIGSNDAAMLSSANVVVTQGLVPATADGVLSITDEDNPALFQPLTDYQGSYGKLTLAADGTWSYLADSPLLVLAPTDVVTDNFTVYAVDGTPTTISVSIAGSNDIAIAQSDSLVTNEATILGAGLNLFLDNGSGPDMDPDSPLAIGAVNGDPAFVGHQITLASGALLAVNADGTFSYDPNGMFNTLTQASGAVNQSDYDSFTYTLAGGTATTVLIRVDGVNSSDDLLEGNNQNNIITGFDPSGDNFRLEQGGNDTAYGLGGNDGFYFGAAYDHNDTVDGGGGTDTVALQGDYAVGATLDGLHDVDVVLALSGHDTSFGDMAGNDYSYNLTSSDSDVGAGQVMTVIGTGLQSGENLAFNGAAETDGGFRMFAGQGTDWLVGGGGSDGFFFGADGNLTAADHVDGGGGVDTIALRGNYSGANAVVMSASTMTNVEVLAMFSGHLTDSGGQIDPAGFDYDITLADGNVAAGQNLVVSANSLGADESLRFDGRPETNGTLHIFSGAGDDTLWGGSGADLIYGGMGADRLIGGPGADVYAYLSAAESTGAHYDTIVGFDWTADRIDAPGGLRPFSQSASGALSTASFDSDLTAAMSGHLSANGASLMTATSGTLAGHLFAVIDTNGVAGYQAGADLVIDLVNPVSPIPNNAIVIV